MYAVIGNTNRTDETCLFGFDKCTPGAIAGLLAAVWGVDEVSIRIEMLDDECFAMSLSDFEHSVSFRWSISQSASFLNELECDQTRFELASSVERALFEAARLSRNGKCFT